MRGAADQVADVRNRRASIFRPINPSKIITAVSGSMHRMPSEQSSSIGHPIDYSARDFFLVAVLC